MCSCRPWAHGGHAGPPADCLIGFAMIILIGCFACCWCRSASSDSVKAHGTAHVSGDQVRRASSKDGFGSDINEIGFECHILPHFNLDTNADLIGYEYKMDSSNPNSNLDTFSI